ncbi:hypothetical protein [Methylobacterium sp. AMS5]|uniref:hypothetical protein n=1 Tax=Methylobacterium sp. AMS5 TaxID=925818 RepID=UPI00074F9097|nr:hypothetical protein [Methylobacterium sp. AMS5]AMB48337.1 hypothetical protein Y590_25550 [Methylobacterium sp. AMS5]
MRQPRKFKTRALRGLEGAPNPSYLNSVWLGFERGVWNAPAEFLRLFGFAFLVLCFIAGFIVIGIPMWIVAQLGVVVMGLLGNLRPQTRPSNNQSVVS